MISFTALILTYNEKENIARTLDALRAVPRVLIVDSFSDDGTADVVASVRPDAAILQRAFDTHSAQWNYGLAQAETDWILALDADYEVSSLLAEEIALLQPGDVAAFAARFEYRIFGHPLRASVYPPRTVLFDRKRATYQQDGHTQLLAVNGPVGTLRGVIYHDDRKPLSRWLRSQDSYVKLEAAHLLATPQETLRRQDRLRLRIYYAPVVMLVYLLFGKGLVLDGWPGWYYVMQRTLAEMLLSLRLLTERHHLDEPQSSG